MWVILGCFLVSCSGAQKKRVVETMPADFVYLHEVDPSIIEEMRYAEDHNFVGKPITGYLAPKCILTREAARALAKVQAEIRPRALSLKVYDCYRPQRAVDVFGEWANDGKDIKMKKEFYPKVDKSNLFRDGYIAHESGHSRGSTVDLTLVRLPVRAQATYRAGETLVECTQPAAKRFKDNSLDFGTGYDCFDPLSHTANPEIGAKQKQNRLLLKSTMEKQGFRNLPEEWWHFTLNSEPHPSTYFDFPVE